MLHKRIVICHFKKMSDSECEQNAHENGKQEEKSIHRKNTITESGIVSLATGIVCELIVDI